MNTDFAGGETICVYLRKSASGSYLWEGSTLPVQGVSDKFSDGNNVRPSMLVEVNRVHIFCKWGQGNPYRVISYLAESPYGQTSHPAIFCLQVREQVIDYSSRDKFSRPTRG
jgi:hypothetical protein